MTALLPRWSDWRPALRAPGADLLAGLIVALVALPLALGFGISSGLGAAAGLATAVIAGAVAAVFGGSRFQVSGPTGAMTVVLVPIFHQHGSQGVLTVGLLAGLLLVVLAVAGVGRAVRYMPAPVIEGFTAGIAVVIALQQFPNALGIAHAHGEKVWQSAFDAVRQYVSQPHHVALSTALVVAAIVLIGGRYLPKLPFALIAVAVATIAARLFGLDLAPIGAIPAGLPAPTVGFVHFDQLAALVAPALAVAALAALESLLSATAADAMAVGTRHNPDRELLGQGLANIAAPLFGGVPATGAIARTAVNVRSGARTRLAALFHAVVLAAIIYLAAPLVADIPLGALAGVLLATTVRMVETASLAAIARASKGDTAIMVATFLVTVALDLVTAVAVGVGIAVVLALRSVAREARLQQIPLEDTAHLAEEHALLHDRIVAYRLEGPLFFAAAHRFLLELTDVSNVHVVVLRMSHLTALDTTGALVLKDAIGKLEHRGIAVLMSGLRPDHRRRLEAIGALPCGGRDEHLRTHPRRYCPRPQLPARPCESAPPMIEHATPTLAQRIRYFCGGVLPPSMSDWVINDLTGKRTNDVTAEPERRYARIVVSLTRRRVSSTAGRFYDHTQPIPLMPPSLRHSESHGCTAGSLGAGHSNDCDLRPRARHQRTRDS